MKFWYQSKIVWFNILMTIVDLASFISTFQGVPEWLVGVSSIVHGVGNIILRIWFTDTIIKR